MKESLSKILEFLSNEKSKIVTFIVTFLVVLSVIAIILPGDLFDSCTLTCEFARAQENISQEPINHTVPDCTGEPWYACPYPLHIVVPVAIGLPLVFGTIGYIIERFIIDEDS